MFQKDLIAVIVDIVIITITTKSGEFWNWLEAGNLYFSLDWSTPPACHRRTRAGQAGAVLSWLATRSWDQNSGLWILCSVLRASPYATSHLFYYKRPNSSQTQLIKSKPNKERNCSSLARNHKIGMQKTHTFGKKSTEKTQCSLGTQSPKGIQTWWNWRKHPLGGEPCQWLSGPGAPCQWLAPLAWWPATKWASHRFRMIH